jgi:dTDP-4-dehydrorhamnose 3,5-epimerase
MPKRFNVIDLPLDGLKKIIPIKFADDRGSFWRVFCNNEVSLWGWDMPIMQINISKTSGTGVFRGLHYQRPPFEDAKFVTCIKGKVCDIVVDLRVDSPTYLKYHLEYLSSNLSESLLIPKGFAHGYQAMEKEVEVLYLHSSIYAPESEAGINIKDPFFNIELPLEISKISDKDIHFPLTNFK